MAKIIQACGRCASTDLRIPGMSDGLLPQFDNLSRWACRRCNHQGVPLEFSNDSDYAAFAEGVGRGREASD